MAIVYGIRPANGTDGMYQRAQTCDRCTVDHDGGWHDGRDDGESCPIIYDALIGEHSYPNEEGPPEWGTDFDTGQWVCTKFVGPCPCDSDHDGRAS
jgi:hypothetical protein